MCKPAHKETQCWLGKVLSSCYAELRGRFKNPTGTAVLEHASELHTHPMGRAGEGKQLSGCGFKGASGAAKFN